MNYVIIGNSAAGIGAAEGIRSVDKTGAITILSKEPEHTYSRPLISYLLGGKTTRQNMKYRPDSFYDDNNICLVFGEATKIDPEKKAVYLDGAQEIKYDRLLIATGSRPFVPPMDGLDSVDKKCTFMSIDDALYIERAISRETRVLIIGAGLIGLKCAEGIYDRVKSIDIVDIADRILPSILTAEASEIVKRHIEKTGVNFILSDSVAHFGKNSARLKGGSEIPFDLLILAVGVRPNTELLKNAGGEVSRGIITNELQETSLPGVYAAGDCTESFDISAAAKKVLAVLPNAYMQGECAGINMAGGKKEYLNAVAMNAIGFMGLHMITAGSYDGDAIFPEAFEDGDYRRLYVKDGYLKGFIMIGNVKRAGIYTSIIRNQIALDSLNMSLLLDKPQLIAFSKEYRKEKLGGVTSGY